MPTNYATIEVSKEQRLVLETCNENSKCANDGTWGDNDS
jgi:hypothetical protein